MDGIVVTKSAETAAHVRRHAVLYLCLIGLAIAGTWELLSMRGVLRPDSWPAPTIILRQLWHDLLHAPNPLGDQNSTLPIWRHVMFTLSKWAFGYVASLLIGSTVGFLLGTSRTIFALGYPVVNILRSLPSAAVWPLCVIVLGLSTRSQFAVITFGAIWPVLLSTVNSLSALPQEVRDSLEFMQLSRVQRMTTQLRWALPGIFTGFEISCSVAFLLTITVEMFHPGNGGMGWYMWSARDAGDAPAAFAGLVLTAALGWALNSGVHQARGYLLFWERGVHERPRPLQKALSRLRTDAEAGRLIGRVRDRRLQKVLRANYVTDEIRREFGEGWLLRVLYNQDAPYVWPSEMAAIVDDDGDDAILQRDVVIDAKIDDDAVTPRPILFAQSWINTTRLSDATRLLLRAGRVTLGDALATGEREITYDNLSYRSVVSDRIGRVLASSGSVETIERRRRVLVGGRPAILIIEHIPILLDKTVVFGT